MPAVFVGEVAQDLAIDRGSGFAQQPRGLGQGQPLGDGGLEVDPVVVPDSLLFLHISVSFLRAAGKEIIGKGGMGTSNPRGLLQLFCQVTKEKRSGQKLNCHMC